MNAVRRPEAAEEPVNPVLGDETVGQAGHGGRRKRFRRDENGQGGGREDREQAVEEPPDLEDASERERGGDERRRLGVPGIGVPVGKEDRVGG